MPELFLGSYAEFLEKDGWGDSPKKAKKNTKDLSKQERALAVQKKSEKLAPVKKRIEHLERTIEEKEEGVKQKEALLITAYENKDPKKIQSLSIGSSELQKELENLYKELEKSYTSLKDLEE